MLKLVKFSICELPSSRLTRKLCIQKHTSPNSSSPLIQSYRNNWPDPYQVSTTIPPIVLPERTVQENLLRFKLSATYEHGTAVHFPHLQFNPSDYKVSLYVSIDDLKLSPREAAIFIEMIGSRYNQGKREVRLISNRFPNRIENKRYLTYLLENLLNEARRINALSDQNESLL